MIDDSDNGSDNDAVDGRMAGPIGPLGGQIAGPIDGPDDEAPVRALFRPVMPLNVPPETFGRIERTVRRRRRVRRASSLASGLAVVVALGFASWAAWPTAVRPTADRVPACTSADLALTVLNDSTSGATAIGRQVLLTNRGPERCQVSGYPAVSLLSSADGGALAVAHHGGTTLWKDPGSHAVRLEPGAAAVFGVEWTPSSATCSNSRSAIGALAVAVAGQPPLPAATLTEVGCLQGDVAVTALVAEAAGLTSSR